MAQTLQCCFIVELDSSNISHSKTVYISQIFQVELKLQYFKEGTRRSAHHRLLYCVCRQKLACSNRQPHRHQLHRKPWFFANSKQHT